jgi:hypothetical protein
VEQAVLGVRKHRYEVPPGFFENLLHDTEPKTNQNKDSLVFFAAPFRYFN